MLSFNQSMLVDGQGYFNKNLKADVEKLCYIARLEGRCGTDIRLLALCDAYKKVTRLLEGPWFFSLEMKL